MRRGSLSERKASGAPPRSARHPTAQAPTRRSRRRPASTSPPMGTMRRPRRDTSRPPHRGCPWRTSSGSEAQPLRRRRGGRDRHGCAAPSPKSNKCRASRRRPSGLSSPIPPTHGITTNRVVTVPVMGPAMFRFGRPAAGPDRAAVQEGWLRPRAGAPAPIEPDDYAPEPDLPIRPHMPPAALPRADAAPRARPGAAAGFSDASTDAARCPTRAAAGL